MVFYQKIVGKRYSFNRVLYINVEINHIESALESVFILSLILSGGEGVEEATIISLKQQKSREQLKNLVLIFCTINFLKEIILILMKMVMH